MANHLLIQALEMQLSVLEELCDEYLGDPEPPLACVECFSLKDGCICANPLFWPLPAALHKLRTDLGAHPFGIT